MKVGRMESGAGRETPITNQTQSAPKRPVLIRPAKPINNFQEPEDQPPSPTLAPESAANPENAVLPIPPAADMQ